MKRLFRLLSCLALLLFVGSAQAFPPSKMTTFKRIATEAALEAGVEPPVIELDLTPSKEDVGQALVYPKVTADGTVAWVIRIDATFLSDASEARMYFIPAYYACHKKLGQIEPTSNTPWSDEDTQRATECTYRAVGMEIFVDFVFEESKVNADLEHLKDLSKEELIDKFLVEYETPPDATAKK